MSVEIIDGEAMDTEGALTAARGFVWDGCFIVNPYASECGRFHVDPVQYYGLTLAQAQRLHADNEKRGLLAIWDL